MANFEKEGGDYLEGTKNAKNEGSGLNQYVQDLIDPSLTWEDVSWLVSITHLPIVAKGVMCGEDAKLAVEAGVKGVWVRKIKKLKIYSNKEPLHLY